jgi:hypothetical protein
MRTITIGRAPSCDIIINDPNVSRVHAEISVEGGQYLYRDTSTNGTVVNGRRINNERVYVMPYASVILASSVPLPWDKLIPLLPLASGNHNRQTVPIQHQQPAYQSAPYHYQQPAPAPAPPAPPIQNDSLGIGWGILAFFIPIAGWIMYFVWRDETPKRAGNAGLLGTIGFVINILYILSSVF